MEGDERVVEWEGCGWRGMSMWWNGKAVGTDVDGMDMEWQ